MAAYLVCELNKPDPEQAKTYLPLVEKVVAKYGGEYLARAGVTRLLEGSGEPDRMVILKFPSSEALLHFYHSEEYAEPKRLRQASAQCRLIMIEGL